MSRLRERKIRIRGWVTIRQGDRVIARRVPNHFVNYGLLTLASYFSVDGLTAAYDVPARAWAAKYQFIYIGQDTTTTTSAGMTDLVSPILTKANVQQIENSNPSPGVYRVLYRATWNAGTISGTCGELGLYLRAWTTLQTAGATAGSPSHGTFVSRLSAADGDFSSFTIDTTKPLTVEWTLEFSFA